MKLDFLPIKKFITWHTVECLDFWILNRFILNLYNLMKPIDSYLSSLINCSQISKTFTSFNCQSQCFPFLSLGGKKVTHYALVTRNVLIVSVHLIIFFNPFLGISLIDIQIPYTMLYTYQSHRYHRFWFLLYNEYLI